MKFLIYPSVLLSVFLSITGVQGQINTDPCVAGTTSADEGTSANSIYFLLCGMGDGSFNVGSPRLQFTIFCAALEQPVLDSLKDILLATTISDGVTVFAPVDAAFAAVGDIDTLATNPALLARIVELHISANGEVLQTSDLDCNKLTCAINTIVSPFGGIIPKRCIQQSRTKCDSAGSSFQIGPGNRGHGDWPAIGQPAKLFTQTTNFANNPDVLSSLDGKFSSNINVCNGVVHVVNQVLLPGTSNSGSGSSKSDKGGKGSKGDGYSDSYLFRRGLVDKGMIDEQDKDNSSHDRRKRLLESLVEPNGNIEQLE